MNARTPRRSVRVRVMVTVALALWLAGCAGAGPAGSGRPRCGSARGDEQRPLFFVFCVESP